MEKKSIKKVLINRTRIDKENWDKFKAIASILFPNSQKPHEELLDKTVINVLKIYGNKLGVKN